MMSEHFCCSSPMRQPEQEQEQEQPRGRQRVRFASGTLDRRSARLRSPPPPPLSDSESESDSEPMDLPTQPSTLPPTSISESSLAATREPIPQSTPISVPGVELRDAHADGSAILWELTRFETIPFVPNAIRPKRFSQDMICAPPGYTWHRTLGCWTLNNDPKTATWGILKPEVTKQKDESSGVCDSNCAVADDDEDFTLVDPAKELERSRRRMFVEYKDITGKRSIIYRQGQKDKAIDAAYKHFRKS